MWNVLELYLSFQNAKKIVFSQKNQWNKNYGKLNNFLKK